MDVYVPGLVSPSGDLEGVPDYALTSLASEHRRLDAKLLGGVGIDETANVGVLAFGVLPDDHHVYVAGLVALDG